MRRDAIQRRLEAYAQEMESLLRVVRALLALIGRGADAEIARVAAHTGIAPEVLMSRQRSERVVLARLLVARALTRKGLNLSEIGRVLRRDHSTIAHELLRFDEWVQTSAQFRGIAQELDLLSEPDPNQNP